MEPRRTSSRGRRLSRPSWTSAAVVGAVLLTLAATACGPSVPNELPAEPAGPSTSSTPTGSPDPSGGASPGSTADPEATLRTQLAAALRPDDPASANQVASTASTLTVLDTDWLPGWRVVDVQVRTMPHPRRFAVALSDDGQARYLSGKPENLNAVLAAARLRVGSTTATQVAATYLDVTRTFERWSYRVADVDDIAWRSSLSTAEQQQRDTVESTYARTIAPMRATPAGEGWTLTGWMVDGTTLVRHDLTLAADGQTTDQATVVARDLPVPASA